MSPIDGMNPILIPFVLFGLTCVGACFIVGMPLVGNVLVSVWGTVMGERALTKMSGAKSGSDIED